MARLAHAWYANKLKQGWLLIPVNVGLTIARHAAHQNKPWLAGQVKSHAYVTSIPADEPGKTPVETFGGAHFTDILAKGGDMFRAIFESAAIGISLVDRQGVFVAVNPAYCRMMGCSAEELVGKTIGDITHVEDNRENQRLNAQVDAGKIREFSLDKRYIRKDGSIAWAHLKVSAIPDETGRPLVKIGMVEDITARKEAEDALRDSEQRFRAIFERAAVGIRVADARGMCVDTNPALQAMLGYSGEELSRMHSVEHTHPDHRAVDRQRFQELVDGTRDDYQYEKRFLRKDGSVFWGLLTVSRLGEHRPGQPFYVALVEDFTERKKAEMATVTAMREAEAANRAKSEFLANMSHEFRTPLNAIIGFTDIMQRELYGPIENEQYRAYLTDIGNSARHLHELIGNFLDLSKIEAGRHELNETAVDLTAVARSCVRMLRQQAEDGGISISFASVDGLPQIHADAGNMRQILLNLLSNAIKFTPAGGTVSVWAEGTSAAGVTLTVRDTGIGMAAEDIPKALALFGQVDSSHTRRYEGTGLGLPLCDALMRQHGGKLRVESAPGEGTAVTIEFPASRIVCGKATAAE